MEKLTQNRIVPVVVIDDPEAANPLADALVRGGIPVAEITFRTAAAATAISALREREDILVGAGTVLDPDQVDLAVAAGAKFIVSPGTSVPVVRRAQELGLPVIPGAVTASEVQRALELGLTTLKFFPAGISGGPLAIRNLASVFRNVKFIPTGGVGPQNLRDYLALPCVAAVGGTWMVPPRLILDGNFEAIEGLVAEAVALTTEVEEGAH